MKIILRVGFVSGQNRKSKMRSNSINGQIDSPMSHRSLDFVICENIGWLFRWMWVIDLCLSWLLAAKLSPGGRSQSSERTIFGPISCSSRAWLRFHHYQTFVWLWAAMYPRKVPQNEKTHIRRKRSMLKGIPDFRACLSWNLYWINESQKSLTARWLTVIGREQICFRECSHGPVLRNTGIA
jgi:hypothetical protein